MNFPSFILVIFSALLCLVHVDAQTVCSLPTVNVITASGASGYQFSATGSTNNPPLQLAIGTTYEFINTVTGTPDPFFIKTALGSGTSNVYTSPMLFGNGQSVVTFTPDSTVQGVTLYYQSSANAGASGTLTFVNPSTCATYPPGSATATTQPPATAAPTTSSSGSTFAPTTTGGATNAPAYLSTSLGCYVDGVQGRILSTKVISDNTAFTRQRCSDAAFNGNYQYYALEYGIECWVGNALNLTYAPKLNGSNPAQYCNYACSGAATQTCGGDFAADLNQITRPPTLAVPTSTATGAIAAWSTYPFSATLAITAAQAGLGLPQSDLLPVYAPWSTGTAASMVLLYLNCPNSQCLSAAQTVYLCIDAESCTAVGAAGYFTVPILGNSALTIYNKVRLIGTNGATADYFLTVTRYVTPTVFPTVFNPYITSAPRCLADSTTARVLTTTLLTTGATVTLCQSLAQAQNFTFFGVEYGQECYGGNVLTSTIASSNCNMPCTANTAQTCGGSFAVSVYQVYLPQTQSLSPGCYADSSTARVLNNKLYSGVANSVESCKALAQSGGYNYYGVEWGVECWADFVYNVNAVTPSTACNYACSGAAAEFCGGFLAINIYSLSTLPTAPAPTTAAPTTQPGATTAVPTTTVTPTTPTSGLRPSSCNGLSFQFAYDGTNGFTVVGYSGDNPTLTVGLGSFYSFAAPLSSSAPVYPIYITTTPTYSAGSIASTSNVYVLGQGNQVTSVLFLTPGTYYYTAGAGPSSQNFHGQITVVNASC